VLSETEAAESVAATVAMAAAFEILLFIG